MSNAAAAPSAEQTPLHQWHLDHGATMTTFAGWQMPTKYTSVLDEHAATRRTGGLFDVSHMGRLQFKGPDAGRLLETVFSRPVQNLASGRSRYGFITNANGGIKDDVIVGRESEDRYPMVCNASNRLKLLDHFQRVTIDRGFKVEIEDRTMKTAMLALQGPAVIERFADVLPVDLDLRGMKRFGFETVTYLFMKFTVSRTGYTGEDGVEVTLPAKAVGMAMKALSSATKDWLKPCGLAARDVLRIEAALPLYGHEIDEETDPLTAGFGWACDLSQDFIGADVLRAKQPTEKLVGLKLDGKRIARQGSSVLNAAGEAAGVVTSGTFSPSLDASIALARVATEQSGEGTALQIDFKSGPVVATVVPLPFYKRA